MVHRGINGCGCYMGDIAMTICNSNRKMFLRDAVTYELRTRMIARYEEMGARIERAQKDASYTFVDPLFNGDYPSLPLPYLANSMKHAIMWDLKQQSITAAKA